ncbi:hypothetical protein ACU8KH_00390 [Lachancea thermotolerans]
MLKDLTQILGTQIANLQGDKGFIRVFKETLARYRCGRFMMLETIDLL